MVLVAGNFDGRPRMTFRVKAVYKGERDEVTIGLDEWSRGAAERKRARYAAEGACAWHDVGASWVQGPYLAVLS